VQTHSRSQARPDFNLFCFLFILALLNKRFNSLMGGFDQPLKAGSPRDFIIVRKMHRSPFLQWRFGAPAPIRSLGLSQVVMRSWGVVPFFLSFFICFVSYQVAQNMSPSRSPHAFLLELDVGALSPSLIMWLTTLSNCVEFNRLK